MKLTLEKIKNKAPCLSGWKTLLKSLGKTEADDEEITLMDVLKSNGIEDAIWCLRCFDYKEYCLFLADVADGVLHLYENKNKDTAPRDAITAIREYKLGKITESELEKAASKARAVARTITPYFTAAYADADAATAATYAAAYSSYAATHAADADANADADAAAAYATADAADAAAYAVSATTHSAKWSKIEELFIKHFESKL